MYFEARNLTKRYGATTVLDDISFGIEDDELVCLLGPSGCGKTTLLRSIAGLVAADSGELTLGGKSLTGIPARRRGFGIVFQSYSLFPTMSVADNIGYGLKIRGTPTGDIAKRVAHLLELINLSGTGERLPWQLSGGQQQRVALARAIAVEPKLLLLDEPLSALDAQVRASLRDEIRNLQRELKIPTIMVTHDQEEALGMADRIICLNRGRIEQVGTPAELYLKPQNRFVADFIGISNLIDAETIGRLAPALLADKPGEGEHLACLRPEAIEIGPASPNGIPAKVEQVMFLGNITRLNLSWAGGTLVAEQAGLSGFRPGTPCSLTFRHCVWVAA